MLYTRGLLKIKFQRYINKHKTIRLTPDPIVNSNAICQSSYYLKIQNEHKHEKKKKIMTDIDILNLWCQPLNSGQNFALLPHKFKQFK